MHLNTRPIRIIAALILLLCFCGPRAEAGSSDEFAAELRSLVGSARHPFLQRDDFHKEQRSLVNAYEERKFEPLWLNGSGELSPQALALLLAMRSANEMGMDAEAYGAASILARASSAARNPQQLAALELATSISALRFISDLRNGRIDPRSAGFDMPERSTPDFATALTDLANSVATLDSLAAMEPQFRHYQLLKKSLAEYRWLAAQPDLTQLPLLGTRSIKPGQPYAGTAKLRSLLQAVGDLSLVARGVESDDTLDEMLVVALKRFQFRHGLRQDGVLGQVTYAALTTPMTSRVRQIELTLERWRWLPQADMPTIIVNIPQFRLFAFPGGGDHEKHMLTMDVIVGKAFPRTRTPVFSADMKYMKFRPYWDVPYNIMATEILPHIRSDPGYLASHGFEMVGSQGDDARAMPVTAQNVAALAAGKLRVRQRPGSYNALGLIKFMLPNHYNVYLHSTPAAHLFDESRRAFSHGCIRVSDPAALAQYVLRSAAGYWSRERIENALNGPDNVRIDLQQSIRVLIVYGTAVATEDGRTYFFADLYGNDVRLNALLHKGSQP